MPGPVPEPEGGIDGDMVQVVHQELRGSRVCVLFRQVSRPGVAQHQQGAGLQAFSPDPGRAYSKPGSHFQRGEGPGQHLAGQPLHGRYPGRPRLIHFHGAQRTMYSGILFRETGSAIRLRVTPVYNGPRSFWAAIFAEKRRPCFFTNLAARTNRPITPSDLKHSAWRT